MIVLCFCCWQGLANRSMRKQDLYVGPFPIPRFISLFFKPYARAHVPDTRTRPRAYARARTLAARQSVQSILGGVSIPVVCVHDLIPDSLWKRLVGMGRPFPHVKAWGGTAQITTQGHRGTFFSDRFQISGDRGTQLLRAIRLRKDHS